MDGVDLYAVKEILGHQDIHTTMRYAHLSPGYLQDAINHGSLLGTGSKTGSRGNADSPTTNSFAFSCKNADRPSPKKPLSSLRNMDLFTNVAEF